MFRRALVPVVAASLIFAACRESPTDSSSLAADDYALVMFGEIGASLEGTLGEQMAGRPFDGRSNRPTLPDSLKLTDEQKAAMHALREAFRLEHADELAALRAIFEEAREARRNGATREEVRAILAEARPIVEALRPDVRALHEALRAILTDAQRAWLDAHRRPHRP